MNQIQLVQITPTELVSLITEGVKQQLKDFSINSNGIEQQSAHLTRLDTAKFFGISLNCVNDWCKKGIITPYKVGQRTYFKRAELMHVLFNQPKRA